MRGGDYVGEGARGIFYATPSIPGEEELCWEWIMWEKARGHLLHNYFYPLYDGAVLGGSHVE